MTQANGLHYDTACAAIQAMQQWQTMAAIAALTKGGVEGRGIKDGGNDGGEDDGEDGGDGAGRSGDQIGDQMASILQHTNTHSSQQQNNA